MIFAIKTCQISASGQDTVTGQRCSNRAWESVPVSLESEALMMYPDTL
jgi:hypothetical protein